MWKAVDGVLWRDYPRLDDLLVSNWFVPLVGLFILGAVVVGIVFGP
jgi:hypothetical protein